MGDVERLLLGLEKDKDGNYVRVSMSNESKRIIYKMIEVEEGWLPIEKLSEHKRKLARLLRQKAVELFGGRVPVRGFKYADGTSSGLLSNNPINDFIKTFDIKYLGTNSPKKFWDDVERFFLGLEKDNQGKYKKVTMRDEVKQVIYKVIEVEEGWSPIEKLPVHKRELARLVRQKAIELFGGRLPARSFKYADGVSSGYLSENPTNRFLKTLEIEYSNANSPTKFWDDVERLLLGLEKDKDGSYVRVPMSNESKRIIYKMIEVEEGWLPIEKLPEHKRKLARLLRQKAVELFGGRLPGKGFKYADGVSSGYLSGNPTNRFIKTLEIKYSTGSAPTKFWDDVERLFLGLEKDKDGNYVRVPMSNESKRIIYKVIEVEEGWLPIEKLPEHKRKLARLLRQKAVELFGGRLPGKGFKYADGVSSGNLSGNPMSEFLKTLEIKYSSSNAPTKFWDDVERLFLGLEKDKDGNYVRVSMSNESKRIIYKMIEVEEGWLPIEKLPEHKRKLARLLRQKVIELFGGRVPRSDFKYTDGTTSGYLQKNPINEFIKTLEIKYSTGSAPAKFWGNVERLLLGVEKNESGNYKKVLMSKEVKQAVYKVIEVEECWVPLEKMPEHRRELAKLIRQKAIELFGGRLIGMGFKYSDGTLSGSLRNNPINKFIRTLEIRYSHVITPVKFWNDVERLLLGVEKNEKGQYKKAPMSKKTFSLITEMRVVAEEEWANKGSARTIKHSDNPVISKPSKGTKLYGGDPASIALEIAFDETVKWMEKTKGETLPATENNLAKHNLTEPSTIKLRAIKYIPKEGISGVVALLASPYIAMTVFDVDPMRNPGESQIVNLAVLHTSFAGTGAIAEVIPQIGKGTSAVIASKGIMTSPSLMRTALRSFGYRLGHPGGLASGMVYAYPGHVAGTKLTGLVTDDPTAKLVGGATGAIGLLVGLKVLLGQKGMQKLATSTIGKTAGPLGAVLLYQDLSFGLVETMERGGLSDKEIALRQKAIDELGWKMSVLEFYATFYSFLYEPMAMEALEKREKLIEMEMKKSQSVNGVGGSW